MTTKEFQRKQTFEIAVFDQLGSIFGDDRLVEIACKYSKVLRLAFYMGVSPYIISEEIKNAEEGIK